MPGALATCQDPDTGANVFLMKTPAASPPGEVPFLYVGGDPCLDLVNTVDWLVEGLANERLTSYDRLSRWAEGAGVLSRNEARVLRRRAASRPAEADAAVVLARSLRAVLRDLFREVAANELSESACGALDGWLALALKRLGVAASRHDDRRSSPARWLWRSADECLESVLWPVTWSAARLLTSGEARRIRVCAGTDCGWIYVDRSRNGFRRWCQMKTCGTSAKTRRRRSRRAKADGG